MRWLIKIVFFWLQHHISMCNVIRLTIITALHSTGTTNRWNEDRLLMLPGNTKRTLLPMNVACEAHTGKDCVDNNGLLTAALDTDVESNISNIL
jgi:hypothetical protein